MVFFAGSYFLRFPESPEQIIDDIFVFIEYMDGSNIFKQQYCVSPDVLSSKTKKLKQITFLCHSITNTNRHDFLATHFLQKKKVEFKIENISFAVNFCW